VSIVSKRIRTKSLELSCFWRKRVKWFQWQL